VREIEAAGFVVQRNRIITETVSGSSAIGQRKGFMKLLDRLEAADVLVVTPILSEAENELGFGERVIAMPWARAWLRARPSILRVCFRRV
jgi:putative DNA-invertase from lambdoid prophage Rac